MITAREIRRFPPTRQVEIQEEIRRMIGMGRPLRYLLLSSDGRIIYDDIMHCEAMMTGFDPESDAHRSE